MPRREVQKILVIKLSALGDFVLALAAMKKIRQAHPKAVWTDGRPEGFAQWVALRKRLRAANFNRVYDLQTSGHSNRIFQVMRPHPPAWSGIAFGAALPHGNPLRNGMHTLERQADQLMYAGIWPDAPTEPGTAPPPDLAWVLSGPSGARPPSAGVKPKPYAMFVPGGSAHRPEKRWPVEKYGELARILYSRGLDVVIIGGPQESALAQAIQRQVPGARDLTGRTDFASIAVLGAKAALAVGNDTGPLHLAAAAGAPTVVLFSSASDPALSAPRGKVAVLQAPKLAELPVAKVAQAAASLLPSGRGAA
jgi:ADP-heptose:LPS heptosyltransferase